jgi:DNA topoisomerase I
MEVRLGVCRKSYIHPEVVEAYLDGTLRRHLGEEAVLQSLAGLRAEEEVAVLALLQQRARQEPHRAAAMSMLASPTSS